MRKCVLQKMKFTRQYPPAVSSDQEAFLFEKAQVAANGHCGNTKILHSPRYVDTLLFLEEGRQFPTDEYL
jgi:hypothetical protein